MRCFENLLLVPLLCKGVRGAEEELQQLMSEMEAETIKFALAIELAYANRCDPWTMEHCTRSSYHGCISELPYATCSAGDGVLRNPACGDGTSCTSLADFTTTTVALNRDGPGGLGEHDNPLGDSVKEAVCYTLQAERYMVKRFQSYSQGTVSSMYFGSDTTAVRMAPAVQLTTCGSYDPTMRPWYVAATSGPKDVILIMDMKNTGIQERSTENNKVMKAAATRIVKTLTVADHVAVVTLNPDSPSLLGGYKMVQATRENVGIILKGIETLGEADPRSLEELFSHAYDILLESHTNEHTSFCNSAILYLTGGESLDSQQDSAENISVRIKELQKKSYQKPYHFFYNMGLESNSVGSAAVMRQVACTVGGLWSSAESKANLTSAMSGYYRLFSLGLAVSENKDFVAWVDPYYYSNKTMMGTTVSAPVYDKSAAKPILLGAVGIDFTMDAMDEALGVDRGNRKTLDRLVQRSIARCPKLNLNQCDIQSLRFISGGDNALCSGECSDLLGMKPQPCPRQPNYPKDFWNNVNNKERTYAERACCSIGETRLPGKYNITEVQNLQCVVQASSQNKINVESQNEIKTAPEVGENNKAQLIGVIIAAVTAAVVLGVGAMIYNIKVTSPAKRLSIT